MFRLVYLIVMLFIEPTQCIVRVNIVLIKKTGENILVELLLLVTELNIWTNFKHFKGTISDSLGLI